MTAYLNRKSSGFTDEMWKRIDAAAIAAAQDILTARRFLDVEGPFSAGLTSVEVGTENYARPAEEARAAVVASRAIGVAMLQQVFDLSIRRVQGHLRMGLPLELRPVEDAAEAVAWREEELIYYGIPEHGLAGLMTAEGHSTVQIGEWEQIEQALNDVIAAVDRLDHSGFRGPYALALSPSRYNKLFRRYEGSDMLQLDHLSRLCEKGVYKAPIDGAVVVDPRVGQIDIGQDLQIGYSANDGIHFRLFASESLVLLLDEPGAVCTLE
jgi:uncharacterized linocin/CFP29 family protein